MHAIQVLVVDSHPDAAESLAILLEMHGYRAQSAHCSASALQRVQSFTPDIVILDIALTGEVDGYGLLSRLGRVLERNPRYIVLTSRDGAEEKSLASGVNAHLMKPVKIRDLLPLLRGESCQDTAIEKPIHPRRGKSREPAEDSLF